MSACALAGLAASGELSTARFDGSTSWRRGWWNRQDNDYAVRVIVRTCA